MLAESEGGTLQTSLTKPEIESQKRLEANLKVLAGDIGERNLYQRASLLKAQNWIEGQFRQYGYSPLIQKFRVDGMECANIIVTRKGKTTPNEIIIVGAHYDSVIGCPGANDNGTGVVALLELAYLFSQKTCSQTLRFVAFVNEEPPYFQTEMMGSLVYAKSCKKKNESIRVMISLETIGYYSSKAGSQKYPFPLSFFYPSTANFVAFVSDTFSIKLLGSLAKSFRKQTSFPLETAAVPSWLPGVGWSDHWSFWKCGYPAMMVTDTALFRYPHYHQSDDTPDKVNYQALAQVVRGLESCLRDMT